MNDNVHCYDSLQVVRPIEIQTNIKSLGDKNRWRENGWCSNYQHDYRLRLKRSNIINRTRNLETFLWHQLSTEYRQNNETILNDSLFIREPRQTIYTVDYIAGTKYVMKLPANRRESYSVYDQEAITFYKPNVWKSKTLKKNGSFTKPHTIFFGGPWRN